MGRACAPLALLLGYGVAFAAWALGFSLIGFDDHPGQLYRVWHVVTRGPAPWAWNPGWWAGYPELQFYPPGLAYAAALASVASRGLLSVAASYQAFVWLAYLAPAVTAWLLLRRVLGDGWLALPGAFVALTLSADLASGVEGGVHTGMVPARLGWALLPLIALALAGWLDGARRFPGTVVPLLAAVVLIHPAHLPAAVVLVLIAAACAPAPRRAAWASGALALVLAAGLTAFWTLPLLVRLSETRALAWGSLSAADVVGHPLALVLVAGAAAGVLARPRAAAISAVLTVFPWIMGGVVLADALVLEPSGLRWLPADRLADSAWLAFVLAAGAVAGRALGSVAGDGEGRRAALALGAVGLAIAIGLPARTLTLWPPAAGWERYATIERGLRLPALWTALRDVPPGRVLFVRSGAPLVYGTAWWRPHSHVTALTPIAAGRAIVNGTFTHPSPVAALLYRGDAGPGAIRELVERLDGHRLFGRGLESLDADTFNAHAERLGVSAVVALDEDVPRLRALRDNATFGPGRASPPFVIYASRAAAGLPDEIAPGRFRVALAPREDGWAAARLAFYPLWHAAADGRPLAVRRGAMGDLEVRAPRPGAVVDLRYERGAAETAGLVVTAGSLAAAAVVAAGRRRRPR
jgi:hypothetical protein